MGGASGCVVRTLEWLMGKDPGPATSHRMSQEEDPPPGGLDMAAARLQRGEQPWARTAQPGHSKAPDSQNDVILTVFLSPQIWGNLLPSNR